MIVPPGGDPRRDLPRSVRLLDDGSAAANHVDQKQDDGDDQQHVDKVTERVATYEPSSHRTRRITAIVLSI